MPHNLRYGETADVRVAELTMLFGFTGDLSTEGPRRPIKSWPIHPLPPVPERIVGAHLNHPALLEVVTKYPTAHGLRRTDKSRWKPNCAGTHRGHGSAGCRRSWPPRTSSPALLPYTDHTKAPPDQ